MHKAIAPIAILGAMALVVGCGDGASTGGGSSTTATASTGSGPAACATGTWDDDGDPSTACVLWTSCTAGQHVDHPGSATSNQTCTACLSGTFTLATNATTCDAWTICDPGAHIEQPGSATHDQVCVACEAGTYSSSPNQSNCTLAGACPAGTVQATPATPTSPPVCNTCFAPGTYCAGGGAPAVVCATGTWDEDMSPASACIAWTECIGGQHVAQNGTALADQTCAACASGTFSATINAPSFTTWTDCIAGQHLDQNGTATADRTCAACANGTFNTTTNASTCTAWSDCIAGQQINQPGSDSANRTCAPCASGTFSTTANVATCTSWSDCIAGQHINQPGGATSNRTCAPCASGTFSTTLNVASCTSWTPCPPGQIEGTPGTSTSNRICVSFWPHQFGTSAYDGAGAVGVDSSGNVVVAGFVGGALPGQTYAGGGDIFIRRYAPDSSEIWTRQFGTAMGGGGGVDALAFDASGAVVIVGYVTGALQGQTFAGNEDAFVSKYAADGTELWTRQFGTSSGDEALGVAVDPSGNVFIAGLAGFGGDAFPGQTSAGQGDAFVRKYAPDGSELWTRQFGTSASDVATGVGLDLSGNILVVGDTQGAFPGLTNAGGEDVFVRKYAGDGTEIWTREFGSSAADYGYAMSTDTNGDVFAVGATYGALPGQTYGGSGDAFVRKYGPDGTALWTRQFGSTASEVAMGASVDASYNLFIAGYTDGTLPGQTHVGDADAFVREYASNGTVLWTQQFGSSSWDQAECVSVGPSGDVFVAGLTYGTFPGQTNAGNDDAFVARFVP